METAAKPEPATKEILPVNETPSTPLPEEDTADEGAPATIPAPDAVAPSPDEEENDDSDEGESKPVEDAPAQKPEASAAPKESGETSDRWAGTMSHEWNERDDAPAPVVPQAAAPKPKTKQKPKITLEEAVGKIPPDALRYIRENFKTDVNHIRAYDPANSVKAQ